LKRNYIWGIVSKKKKKIRLNETGIDNVGTSVSHKAAGLKGLIQG
jgi:hypothetical protein